MKSCTPEGNGIERFFAVCIVGYGYLSRLPSLKPSLIRGFGGNSVYLLYYMRQTHNQQHLSLYLPLRRRRRCPHARGTKLSYMLWLLLLPALSFLLPLLHAAAAALQPPGL